MTGKRLSTKSVAVLLGRSPHWVSINAKRLGIPRYRLGGMWVYEEGQVLAWFEKQKEAPSNVALSKKGRMEVIL
jgi:hypothetical protein